MKDGYEPYLFISGCIVRHPKLELLRMFHDIENAIVGIINVAGRTVILLATDIHRADLVTKEEERPTNWFNVAEAVIVRKSKRKDTPALTPK